MDKKLGQEPAFPPSREVQELNPDCEGYNIGMSKRFYAACTAMQGILSASSIMKIKSPHIKLLTEMSYEIADELLKQENE